MREIMNRYIGMDAETRKQTVLAFVTALIDFLTAFHIIAFTDAQIQAIYKLALCIVTAIVWGYCSHYKNNNFTEAGCIGTGVTRQIKAEQEGEYIGDYFFTDIEDDEEVGDEDE